VEEWYNADRIERAFPGETPADAMVNQPLKPLGHTGMMRDSDVRTAVKGRLEAKHANDPHTRIVEEMGIWSGSVRIDIAVINGELHGFELKSERDTLIRLNNQEALYSQVFDRMTLVTAQRHLDKAVNQIPDWWGVTAISMKPGEPSHLSDVRAASLNRGVEAIQLARLLWNVEALEIMERRGLSKGFKNKTVEIIAERLAEVLSLKDLSFEVRAVLKSRSGWLGESIGHQRYVSACGD
jgi:hypothetical protein